MDDKLKELVEQSRKRIVTEEEREDQRIGFAYGNAPASDRNTKESIRDIANAMRAMKATKVA